MADYKSSYTGEQIDAGIGKANTAIQTADLADYQGKIDSSNKLSADLVDDTSTTNKFVTASDKTTWDDKQDALVSGTNIKTINNVSILGEGNIDIEGGGSATPYELQDYELDLEEMSFECSNADAEYIFTNNPIAISMEGVVAIARIFLDDESKSEYSRTYTFLEFHDDDQIIVYEIALYWDGEEYSFDVKPTDPIGGTEVSGTNDGTNWTALTIDGTTKNIPSGGSGGESDLYIIDIEINPYTRDLTFASGQTISFVEAPGMSGVYMGQVANMPQTINNLPDVVYITYNGTSYKLPLVQENSGNAYYGEIDNGAPIFDKYPFFFAILNEGGIQGMIATNIDQSSMQLSVRGVTYIMYGITINNSSDASFQDIINAVNEGKIPIVRYVNPALPDKTYYATVYGEIGKDNINFRGDYDDKIALDFKYGSGSGSFEIRGYLKELPIVCTTSGSTIDFSVDLYNILNLYNQQKYYIELDGERYETTKTSWQDEPMSFGITGNFIDTTNNKLKVLSLTYTYPSTKTSNLIEYTLTPVT